MAKTEATVDVRDFIDRQPITAFQGRATGVPWMMGIGRCGGIVGALFGAEPMRRKLGFDLIFTWATVPAVIATRVLKVKLFAVRTQPRASSGADRRQLRTSMGH